MPHRSPLYPRQWEEQSSSVQTPVASACPQSHLEVWHLNKTQFHQVILFLSPSFLNHGTQVPVASSVPTIASPYMLRDLDKQLLLFHPCHPCHPCHWRPTTHRPSVCSPTIAGSLVCNLSGSAHHSSIPPPGWPGRLRLYPRLNPASTSGRPNRYRAQLESANICGGFGACIQFLRSSVKRS